MEVYHSPAFFTCEGPVIIVLTGGEMSCTGVWSVAPLLNASIPDRPGGIEVGTQLKLVHLAHTKGYPIALVNLNSVMDSRPL